MSLRRAPLSLDSYGAQSGWALSADASCPIYRYTTRKKYGESSNIRFARLEVPFLLPMGTPLGGIYGIV